MRRYDYIIGAVVKYDNPGEPFSGYSIADGKIISFGSEENFIYDDYDEDL